MAKMNILKTAVAPILAVPLGFLAYWAFMGSSNNKDIVILIWIYRWSIIFHTITHHSIILRNVTPMYRDKKTNLRDWF